MTDTRAQLISSLGQRIERGSYRVDTAAVAAAILDHPAGRRLILPGRAPVRPADAAGADEPGRATRSHDVLEAA